MDTYLLKDLEDHFKNLKENEKQLAEALAEANRLYDEALNIEKVRDRNILTSLREEIKMCREELNIFYAEYFDELHELTAMSSHFNNKDVTMLTKINNGGETVNYRECTYYVTI